MDFEKLSNFQNAFKQFDDELNNLEDGKAYLYNELNSLSAEELEERISVLDLQINYIGYTLVNEPNDGDVFEEPWTNGGDHALRTISPQDLDPLLLDYELSGGRIAYRLYGVDARFAPLGDYADIAFNSQAWDDRLAETGIPFPETESEKNDYLRTKIVVLEESLETFRTLAVATGFPIHADSN